VAGGRQEKRGLSGGGGLSAPSLRTIKNGVNRVPVRSEGGDPEKFPVETAEKKKLRGGWREERNAADKLVIGEDAEWRGGARSGSTPGLWELNGENLNPGRDGRR